jgi:hypothetical protein
LTVAFGKVGSDRIYNQSTQPVKRKAPFPNGPSRLPRPSGIAVDYLVRYYDVFVDQYSVQSEGGFALRKNATA